MHGPAVFFLLSVGFTWISPCHLLACTKYLCNNHRDLTKSLTLSTSQTGFVHWHFRNFNPSSDYGDLCCAALHSLTFFFFSKLTLIHTGLSAKDCQGVDFRYNREHLFCTDPSEQSPAPGCLVLFQEVVDFLILSRETIWNFQAAALQLPEFWKILSPAVHGTSPDEFGCDIKIRIYSHVDISFIS